MIEAARVPYAALDAKLRLLVFGGSQGARGMAEIVPKAIERLSAELRARLAIVQQARGEDLETVRAAYAKLGVAAETAAFFPDLPARLAAAHLVIARSGASTVAELAAIGRPAILVPLPHALDQDQFVNAGVLADAGGAIPRAARLHARTPGCGDRPARRRSAGSRAWRRAPSAGTFDAAERWRIW